MKKIVVRLMLVLAVVTTLAACGGGHDGPDTVVRHILSDDTVDGDIKQSAADGSLTLAQVARDGLGSVFAGVDPATGDEYRAFLDFPLTSVPGNAIIQSARLDLFIVDVKSPLASGSTPIRIELVSFPPPLITTDFNRAILPPLAATTVVPPIAFADQNGHVAVDVTSLVEEAQIRGLAHFQVRILEDLGIVTPGLVEIDDTGAQTAPLLTVVYF